MQKETISQEMEKLEEANLFGFPLEPPRQTAAHILILQFPVSGAVSPFL